MFCDDELDNLIEKIGLHRVLESLANVADRRGDLDPAYIRWADGLRSLAAKVRQGA